jgi:hypothetical protein
MKYLYGVKGCCRCDSRSICPHELKNNKQNLLTSPKSIHESGRGTWISYCNDFFRESRI